MRAPVVAEARRKPGRPRKQAGAPLSGELILLAAMKVFADKGYNGAGLREIARECGLDQALISRSYGSKMGLWQAVVDHHAAFVLQVMESAYSALPSASPGERLRSVLCAYVDIVYEVEPVSRFLIRELADRSEKSRYRYMYNVLMKPIMDMMLPYIEEAVEAQEIPHFDPEYLFISITGSITVLFIALGENREKRRDNVAAAEVMANIKRHILLMTTKSS